MRDVNRLLGIDSLRGEAHGNVLHSDGALGPGRLRLGVSGILCDAGRLMVDWSGSLFVLVDHNTRSAVSSPKGGRSSHSGFFASG